MIDIRLSLLAASISLLALAGCASDDPASGPPMFCPQVAVLQQAAVLTEFLPGHRDVASEITTAQVTGVAGSCTLQPKKHQLTLKFQAGFAATSGPANNFAPLTLPYFVAITDDDNIVQEGFYTVALNFDGNASTAEATTQPIKLDFPNRHWSGHVQVLVGFQESQDELDYAAAHPQLGQ
jgi:hypothetical protein